MVVFSRLARACVFASMIVFSPVLSATIPAIAQEAMMLPVDPAPLVAETSFGPRRFSIEIADDPTERARGLMFRESMPDDRGMLFVFDATRPVGFWMRNTPMPLDLVFIGEDGVVRAILPGEPLSDDTISPGPGVPIRFVLELKRGTAKAAGIREGTRLVHPAIVAAAG
ncbi:MAG: DUF192 domain-containing protein [Rhizobiaceae bacterium]|nr:DUF192 domain-containing protein [Rhizobiaceae bacterium]MCV0408638.1 DUF192 domain-containing protein [Rhizobiaceae bacterium]